MTWTAFETPATLQMAFFQSGRMDHHASGWVHKKTVPYFVMAQAIRGDYEVEFDAVTVRVKFPGVFVAPPDTELRITHHPDRFGYFSSRWVHFSCALFQCINLADLQFFPRQLTLASAREFSRLMDSLEHLSGSLTEMAFAREIAWRAVRLASESAKERPGTESLLQAGERLHSLMIWLRLNLSETITVADMARVSGMSPSRLHAFFRDRLSRSPQQFLKDLRLESTASFLLSSDMPVKEIAAKSGFANQFHLSREFRRRFGASPREFRRINIISH